MSNDIDNCHDSAVPAKTGTGKSHNQSTRMKEEVPIEIVLPELLQFYPSVLTLMCQ